MDYWVIEDAGGCQHQVADDPTPFADPEDEAVVIDRYPDAVLRAALPRAMDLSQERWDFEGGAIVTRWSPVEAHAIRWEQAKAYYLERTNGDFALPGIGTVQSDAGSREAIRTLADEAREKIEAGDSEWSTSFKNLANERMPVTAIEIIAVYAALRGFLGACYDAKEDVADALAVALSEGASAVDILAIDITAGYPEP
jgi:hypothetical protein